MEEFLNLMDEATSTISDASVLDELKGKFQNIDLEVGSIQDTFRNMDLELKDNNVYVNNFKLKGALKDIREGRMQHVFSETNVTNNVTLADELEYKNVYRKTVPDISLGEIDDLHDTYKTIHIDLEINAQESGEKLYDNLSESSKAKIESIYKKLESKAKSSSAGKIAGYAVGGLALGLVGIALYNELNDLVANARNCRYKIGDTNCVLVSKVCSGSGTGESCSNDILQSNFMLVPNVYLAYKFIQSGSTGSDLMSQLLNNIQIKTDSDFNAAIADLTTVGINNNILVTNNYKLSIPACTILKESTSNCVACDPYADINSSDFIDRRLIPYNATVFCNRNATVLSVLSDYAYSNGISLFTGISTSINSILSQFTLPIVIIVVVIIVLSVAYNLWRNRNSSKQNQPPQIMYYAPPPQPPPQNIRYNTDTLTL